MSASQVSEGPVQVVVTLLSSFVARCTGGSD